ncbi:hypothetical protein LJC46_09035 [Desulfovibrio sp. OttesenSCG-928-G15]|nr:hypothetical protein [Desulfovibrio sp. OttesenSCG-928-G15]
MNTQIQNATATGVECFSNNMQTYSDSFVRLPEEVVLSSLHTPAEQKQDETLNVTIYALPGTYITAVSFWRASGGMVSAHENEAPKGTLCVTTGSAMDRISLFAENTEEFTNIFRHWFYTLHQKDMAGMQIGVIAVRGAQDPRLCALGWLKGICRSHGIAFENIDCMGQEYL